MVQKEEGGHSSYGAVGIAALVASIRGHCGVGEAGYTSMGYKVEMAELDATNAEGFSMRNVASGARITIAPKLSARLSLGSWVVLIVLVALLFAACVVGYIGWKLADGVDVPISGYVAMVVGVIASLAVGFGLMALIFYSSRKGYDEPPVLIDPENDFKEFESPSKRAS